EVAHEHAIAAERQIGVGERKARAGRRGRWRGAWPRATLHWIVCGGSGWVGGALRRRRRPRRGLRIEEAVGFRERCDQLEVQHSLPGVAESWLERRARILWGHLRL